MPDSIYCSSVFPEAILTSASINQSYFNGDTAVLECIGMGGPNNTYLWQANGEDITGEVLRNLTLSNITADSGREYTCVVTNPAGSHNTSTFLFVYPYFVSHPGEMLVSVDDMILLTCGAMAFPNPDYLWQRADEGEIRGDRMSRVLNISTVQFGDEGEYSCNATANGITVQSANGIIFGTYIHTYIHT
jgi:hypothetical protein